MDDNQIVINLTDDVAERIRERWFDERLLTKVTDGTLKSRYDLREFDFAM
ncbi:MAG: hypothetical protein WA941_12350 [Nitrososphaeraceae archaeon]